MDKILVNNQVPWKLSDSIWIMLISAVFVNLNLFLFKIVNFNIESIHFKIILNIIYTMLPILLVILTLKYRYKINIIENLGLKITLKNFPKYFWGGCIIFVLILSSSLILSMLVYLITGQQVENPYKDISTDKLMFLSLFALFFAPILEEIFFRGFMLPAACDKYGETRGLYFVSIVFTLLHFQYFGNIPAMILLLIIALILGFSRLYYKSIIPGIIGHFFNNFIAFIALIAVKSFT